MSPSGRTRQDRILCCSYIRIQLNLPCVSATGRYPVPTLHSASGDREAFQGRLYTPRLGTSILPAGARTRAQVPPPLAPSRSFLIITWLDSYFYYYFWIIVSMYEMALIKKNISKDSNPAAYNLVLTPTVVYGTDVWNRKKEKRGRLEAVSFMLA